MLNRQRELNRFIDLSSAVRHYAHLTFCTYEVDGTYHFRVFSTCGFVWDSGGSYPLGWTSVMQTNTAITTWIVRQQNRGVL